MPTPTPEQKAAIEHSDGNLLILACAGSGKTETLALRIAEMVKNGASRESIVAFTFTDNAAAGLKQRIRQKLEEYLPEEPSLGDMYVGTIHSFCRRVLHEYRPSDRRYEVMDEVAQAALIAANFVYFDDSGSGIGLDRLRSRTRSGTYGETLRTFLNTLNVIHQQKIGLKKLDDPVLRDVVKNYQDLAYGRPNYFFDFNQIIDALIDFLEVEPDKLRQLQQKLTHIFVDEYQDVDDRQEHLIRLLSDGGQGPRVTVVGDDDQALYGFRGASVKNILTFKDRYPDVTTTALQSNFRSTHAIVSIADEAVRQIPERIEKEPIARKPTGSGKLVERMADPGDIQLQTFESEEEEARWVAGRIQELQGVEFEDAPGQHRGLDYGDMAILLRSVRRAGAVFAETLRAHGIPVVISGTRGLFNNDEVRLLQASFCLLARSEFAIPDDDGRIQLLNTVDTREFVRDTIQDLRDDGRLGKSTNSTHYLSWIDQRRADLDERAMSKDERRPGKGARIYPQEIYHEMLQTLGSQDDEWPSDLLYNFGAFSTLLTKFESVHQWITPARLRSLTLFLSNWAASNVDEGGIDEVAGLNSVRIMTVHAAKGLEWPVVFLPRISSRVFPSNMRTRGPDTFLRSELFDPKTYAGGDDGERRLWYVALTRCAKFLNVSSLDRRNNRPTNYFGDLDHDCISRNGQDPTPRKIVKPEPPTDAELLPTTYTDLATFWRCEYEYKLRSMMDFSPGVGEQFGYGQQLHNILAEIHSRAIEGDPISESEIRSLVNERFHLRYTRGRPFEAMRDAAASGLERYVKKFGDELLNARAVEKPFELIDADSGALISGVVDLLERGEPEEGPSKREIVGLVDFKAKQIGSKEEYNEIAKTVADQLQLYALGVRYALSKEPHHAAAHVISHKDLPDTLKNAGVDERIPIDVSEQARSRVQKKVGKAVGDIRRSLQKDEFKRTGVKNKKCGTCDFRVFCKGYSELKSASKRRIASSTPEEDRIQEVDDLMEDVGAGSQDLVNANEVYLTRGICHLADYQAPY